MARHEEHFSCTTKHKNAKETLIYSPSPMANIENISHFCKKKSHTS